ncbi:MAG: hypothetical protein R2736_21655 [Solirubrobacterales bacterium]
MLISPADLEALEETLTSRPIPRPCGACEGEAVVARGDVIDAAGSAQMPRAHALRPHRRSGTLSGAVVVVIAESCPRTQAGWRRCSPPGTCWGPAPRRNRRSAAPSRAAGAAALGQLTASYEIDEGALVVTVLADTPRDVYRRR